MVAERLNAAMNAHDIDAFVACFDEQYESEHSGAGAARSRMEQRSTWPA
jgi:hypothetical protein